MKSQSTTKSKEVTNSIRKMDPANLQRMNKRPIIRRATEQQKNDQKTEEQQTDKPTSETDTPPSGDSQPKS